MQTFQSSKKNKLWLSQAQCRMTILSRLHHKTPLLTAKCALAPIFPQKMTLNQYLHDISETHKPTGLASRKRNISGILSSNEPALTLSRQRIICSQLSLLDGSAKRPWTIMFYLSYLPANLQCTIQKHTFSAYVFGWEHGNVEASMHQPISWSSVTNGKTGRTIYESVKETHCHDGSLFHLNSAVIHQPLWKQQTVLDMQAALDTSHFCDPDSCIKISFFLSALDSR